MKSLRILVFSATFCVLVATTRSSPLPENKHLADSKIYNIRPLLEGAPKTQKNVKFSTELQSKKLFTNQDLFKHLGLHKMHISSGQQKKRLAEQSRHHGHPDDSDMFIIKLPPNTFYYGNNKNSITDHNSKKINLGFQSNGKLGRIYHWNLPVLKKMLGSKGRNPNFRGHVEEEDEMLDIKNIPTWSDPWDNDTMDKQYKEELEKKMKKKTPIYYAPAKVKKMQKYFPGNGKPKSFYVMKKSKKPVYYQKLITP